jgi:hypothetical protein
VALEVGDLDGAPALGGSGHRGKHELEHRFLTAAQAVGGARGAAMGDRQTQMGDAGFKIVHEAGHRARQAGLVVGDDVPSARSRAIARLGA